MNSKTTGLQLVEFKESSVKYSSIRKDEYITDIKDSTISHFYAYCTDKYARFEKETMFRVGNTFEFFLKRRIAKPRTQGDIVIKNHYMIWIPYQLDMESGEFY